MKLYAGFHRKGEPPFFRKQGSDGSMWWVAQLHFGFDITHFFRFGEIYKFNKAIVINDVKGNFAHVMD